MHRDEGFSLLEALIASALVTTALVSMAELFVVSVKNNAAAATGTMAQILASQKMEQLRSLTFGFNVSGLPTSDTESDTTISPAAPTGGTGLSLPVGNTLHANTHGYVDYLDRNGDSLGGGSSIPANTAFIRRWHVERLAADPDNMLVLQVLVTRLRDRGDADAGRVRRLPGEARLVTLKARKGP